MYATGTANDSDNDNDDNHEPAIARNPTIRTEMVIRRLVFLGSGHFGLERTDLILNFGHGKA
jgi:hypothetical protein